MSPRARTLRPLSEWSARVTLCRHPERKPGPTSTLNSWKKRLKRIRKRSPPTRLMCRGRKRKKSIKRKSQKKAIRVTENQELNAGLPLKRVDRGSRSLRKQGSPDYSVFESERIAILENNVRI